MARDVRVTRVEKALSDFVSAATLLQSPTASTEAKATASDSTYQAAENLVNAIKMALESGRPS